MSINQDTPAANRTAANRMDSGEGGGAEVYEIYPGASSVVPVQPHGRSGPASAQAGMATAEYAIATLAAVGFAGVLVFIMRSDEVRGFLLNLIRTALTLP
ncbi:MULTISPECIES: DUF4244 domain-containing protein [unclassified Arthrobacter]|uniref:DUF4244 domain-containing protein n=1 Tax=unclassified Arthrobacter TaxID=235627 RepID=UPI001D1EB412|nr:DUF4244 domain-containing protein [Arthrobacter sp. Bi26]CAH0203808.1 hypothetical protein SRABI26_01985 [Arthrobacter sp. Bi26]